MQVGRDFPDTFTADNYVLRHTTGHNMYDPEALITGADIAEGLSYDNSHRSWLSPFMYDAATTGEKPDGWIEAVAPRILDSTCRACGRFSGHKTWCPSINRESAEAHSRLNVLHMEEEE